MPLQGATLLPHALMPLRIFEPRYRKMLRHALEGDRLLCIAQIKPGLDEARTTDDFLHTAGLGVIRACITMDDGTSNLILQGLARVSFTCFPQESPFRIAELRTLLSQPANEDEIQELNAKLLNLCTQLRAAGFPVADHFDHQLAQLASPEAVGDFLAHHLLQHPGHRQQILEETHPIQRLNLLLRLLKTESA